MSRRKKTSLAIQICAPYDRRAGAGHKRLALQTQLLLAARDILAHLVTLRLTLGALCLCLCCCFGVHVFGFQVHLAHGTTTRRPREPLESRAI